MTVLLAEIHDRAAALIDQHAATPEQCALLQAALADLWRKPGGNAGHTPLCVDLPLLVYAAITGDDAPAAPVAVAGLLLYAAVELLDDLMDGDLSPAWSDHRPGEVMLAGSTLIAALPSLALLDAGAELGMAAALQRILARGLLAMSAGQQGDLALTGSGSAPVEVVDAVVRGKSGALPAMMGAMAARLAGAPEPVIEQYEAMGRALGTARQIRSDCHDLFGPGDSRDLLHGTRTMPLALYQERVPEEQQATWIALLAAARHDAGARASVRKQLEEAGTLPQCALLIDLYCDTAQHALSSAAPAEPSATRLRELIDEVRFSTDTAGAGRAASG